MIDIHQFISWDKELLLFLNGSESLFWDGFMWTVSSTKVWIMSGVVLLYVIFKNKRPLDSLLILLMISLVVLLADQFASGLCKPYFHRLRPTQDPELMYLVDVVHGYRGGRYGFISSHAANTFGFATFVSLLMRNRGLSLSLFAWALIPSFSRIYLGVHYPGDVLCGALSGALIGYCVYLLYRRMEKRLFVPSFYVSEQYTSSGYQIRDIKIFELSLILTFFYIMVSALCI